MGDEHDDAKLQALEGSLLAADVVERLDRVERVASALSLDVVILELLALIVVLVIIRRARGGGGRGPGEPEPEPSPTPREEADHGRT